MEAIDSMSNESHNQRIMNQRVHGGVKKTKGIVKRGRWSLHEKKAFLRGFQKYGRGRWKAIAKLIPQRCVILEYEFMVYLFYQFI